MDSKNSVFFKGSIFTIIFLLFCTFVQAQLLEIDYTKDKREENTFKVQFIRTGIIGASSLKNLDLTVEALKLTLNNKQKNQFTFTLYGTNTVWRGNRIDELNTFDFLMNPIGGRINASFFTSYTIDKKDLQNTKLALSLGKKWIQGPSIPNFKNSSFIENYGRLGWIYQKTLAEDAITNSALYFWAFPNLIFHQMSEENIKTFFNDQLDPFSYGYALEFGLEYNKKVKITLIGQQILNSDPEGDFDQIVARLIFSYRF
jgi:hypothetical protein